MAYREGQLVWAKMRGHPHWPAKVARCPKGQPRPQGKLWIFFYGTHEHAWMPAIDLCSYEENKARFSLPKKIRGFAEAIWEIEEDPDLVITLGRPPSKRRRQSLPAAPEKGALFAACEPEQGPEEAKPKAEKSSSKTLETQLQSPNKPIEAAGPRYVTRRQKRNSKGIVARITENFAARMEQRPPRKRLTVAEGSGMGLAATGRKRQRKSGQLLDKGYHTENYNNRTTEGEGAMLEATEEGATVEATEKGATAEATEEGATVEATEKGATVEATEEGAMLEPTEEASTVKATEEGATVEATEEGATVEATEEEATVETTEEGATAEEEATVATTEEVAAVATSEEVATLATIEEGATLADGATLATTEETATVATSEEGTTVATTEEGTTVATSEEGATLATTEERATVAAAEEGATLATTEKVAAVATTEATNKTVVKSTEQVAMVNLTDKRAAGENGVAENESVGNPEPAPAPTESNLLSNQKEMGQRKAHDNEERLPQLMVQQNMSGAQMLMVLNYNLKASLTVQAPDVKAATATLHQLQNIQFAMQDLQSVPDIVATIRKVRCFNGSEDVRALAEEVYSQMKNSFQTPGVLTRPPAAGRARRPMVPAKGQGGRAPSIKSKKKPLDVKMCVKDCGKQSSDQTVPSS